MLGIDCSASPIFAVLKLAAVAMTRGGVVLVRSFFRAGGRRPVAGRHGLFLSALIPEGVAEFKEYLALVDVSSAKRLE